MSVPRYPMQPYPTSWYRVADSADVVPGAVKGVHYFGRDLVVFRDGRGAPVVADAHCPHLGANLAVGGRIEDGALVCPFHSWRYDGSGRCVGIPYTDRIPQQARLRTYPACEINGVVAVYYDELGRDPEWAVPEIPEYDSTEHWTGHITKIWKIRTHLQEIFDNAADAAHQQTLHAATEILSYDAEPDGVYFRGQFTGTYDAGEGLPEQQAWSRNAYLHAGLGFSQIDSKLDYNGLVIDRQIHSCFTPVDEEHIDFVMYQRTRRLDDDGLTELIHQMTAQHTWRSIEEDIPIWENKVFRPLPSRTGFAGGAQPAHLCDKEGDIAKTRNWARQFYTDAACGV
ncbi:Rieske 2Fe-2S domain-containing protein, partial [Nonomuraea sp. RK-328]|nr:Rieske 2Fe-2S domain-containing protein [Nonomuraea sp. RK-328]